MTKLETALRKRERAKRAWIKAERAYIDVNAGWWYSLRSEPCKKFLAY